MEVFFRSSSQRYLEIHSECDMFILQIHAFLDNYFDVGQLLEDSETKQQAIAKVSELEEQLGAVSASRALSRILIEDLSS